MFRPLFVYFAHPPRSASFFTTLFVCFAIIWLIFIIRGCHQRSNRSARVLINNVLFLFCTVQPRMLVLVEQYRDSGSYSDAAVGVTEREEKRIIEVLAQSGHVLAALALGMLQGF